MQENETMPPLPDLNEAGGYFWLTGEKNIFSLGWCKQCSLWLHPARTFCPDCFTEAEQKPASGKAHLISYTVNHQQWLSGYPPPYIIAIVSPAEESSIQITTNLRGVDEKYLRIGMQLEADFVPYQNVWLPLFKPCSDEECDKHQSPLTNTLPDTLKIASPKKKFEDQIIFSGIGKSRIGRKLNRSGPLLLMDACRHAIEDAGLTPSDIDGICAFPGSSGMAGFSSGGVRELAYNMNLKPTWHNGAQETPGQTGPLVSAMMAVSSGLCRHVLCFTNFSTTILPQPNLAHISGERRWSLPYGCVSPANWIAMYANRYMNHYGVDETLLGKVAIAARQHAALNPDAIYREPLDMETYMASRKISSPFKLLDCDMPCDGAIAFIISHIDYAPDLPNKPVYVEACATAFSEIQSWDQSTVEYQPNVFSAARHLWSRTDLQPADIDVAELYDGFTFNAVCWLEALGFCEPGGANDFIGNGEVISPGGKLPLNTHGGHLNAGRSNGYGHVYEAIVQLRGMADARQVPGARTAVTACGGGIPAGALLLKSFQ